LTAYRTRRTALADGSAAGSTIMEILIVLAIIAILSAVLFPALVVARRRAAQATCLSNLRELGAGMGLYRENNDGRLPWARVLNGGAGNPAGNWAGCYDVHGKCAPEKGQLYRYIRNRGVYLCPSSKNAQLPGIVPEALPYPLSYSMNDMLTGAKLDSETNRSSRIGLLVHESPFSINDGDFYWLGWSDGIQGRDEPADVHSGGTCVLFCDLHASWQTYDAVIDALSHYGWDLKAH